MNADEMLFNLGFKKLYDKPNSVSYIRHLLEIDFDNKFKSIDIYNDSGEELWGNTIYNSVELSLELLQAINKKVKELGWNNETRIK